MKSCFSRLTIIMADRPSTVLASISAQPIFHQTLRYLSHLQAHAWTDDSMGNIPESLGTMGRIIHYITFVQGQTPVTPPTLANTKENWMEEGTHHVICVNK